ncbi:MAG: 30S ribosomal protein S9 [Candidatus Cloacimonadales bacterium]|jgi:small subunit ribosomal protein S9|nr:30S ribosomal protein S9 [Candidatus Cloacimonadota bacterium]MDD3501536.1 30S ribosomal protein S9 [Candidatus Cloacimonadota bacterium]MDX9978391.1 30S ribosomal protein S9 [Candidatus Cloacimonadales bacterium]
MQYFDAVGRRKTSVARVRITPGTGKRIINSVPMKKYLAREVLEMVVEQAFELVSLGDKFDLKVNVCGGGLSSQAGAIRHGVSRALIKYDDELRHVLKEKGLLTRDSRMVERKKPGRPKARKRFQFSKR